VTGDGERGATPSLSYARPRPSAPPRADPFAATMLCLPGLICWITFLSVISRFLLPAWVTSWLYRVPFLGGFATLALWFIAICTAIASAVLYGRMKRKPWYVWLNLTINVSGLMITAVLLGLLVFALSR
jgi:hypothetical protein